MMARNPQLGRIQVRAEGLAQLHRRGQGRGQAAPKVNEIIASAKASGDIDKMAVKWLGRPAGDLPN
jgi:polar amino acid transport system substrate-binding protein